jgi:hypothetical protein
LTGTQRDGDESGGSQQASAPAVHSAVPQLTLPGVPHCPGAQSIQPLAGTGRIAPGRRRPGQPPLGMRGSKGLVAAGGVLVAAGGAVWAGGGCAGDGGCVDGVEAWRAGSCTITQWHASAATVAAKIEIPTA